MADPTHLTSYADARRIFEETLTEIGTTYAPVEDFVVNAVATTPQGVKIVVARYRIYTDGRFECIETLDGTLWPPL